MAGKRRTTLTLPSQALDRAEKIAAERHVTLSTVIAETLEDGFAARDRATRADAVLAGYRAAFSNFTEQERLLLDGVELEPEVV